MTPLEFVGFWQANPFRPFRVVAKDVIFDVVQAMQVSMSPNMQRVTVTLDDEVHSLRVEDILRCEWNAAVASQGVDRPSYPEPAAPHHSYGVPEPDVVFDSGATIFTAAQDGEDRLVHVKVVDERGAVCLDTAGTRFDVDGIEPFENGTTVYLHHLDEPGVERRLILWPGRSGTFESFAEATGFGAIQSRLKSMDAALRAAPKPFTPPESYFESLIPKPVYEASSGNWWEKDQPDPPGRFRVELDSQEVGRHQYVTPPRIVDTKKRRVIFDLAGTSWDGQVPQGEPPWDLILGYGVENAGNMSITVNPATGKAKPPGAKQSWPLDWVEGHLINFRLYERWSSLLPALAAGPMPPDAPSVRYLLPGAHVLEWWPGAASVSKPYMQPRLRTKNNVVLFDFRGSQWGATIEPEPDSPRLLLQVMSADVKDQLDAMRVRLEIDLATRRVTTRTIPGSTTLSRLQAIVHKARGSKWFLEELGAAFTLGRSVRVPAGGESP